MKQNLRRLATAAALAFATVTTTLPASAQDTPQAPATGEATYKVAGEPRVLLSCTKDGHAFRILAVPGAPSSAVDTAPDSVPAQSFMDGMEKAINAVVSKYNFADLTATETPLAEVNQATRDYVAKFNADHKISMVWAALDYGLTADKDPVCAAPQSPSP
ncbi:MAG: hypothetical protein ACXW30_05570 [Micavibrio sp.]